MKPIILLTCFLALNATAQTEGPCEAPKQDVIAMISGFTVGDNGQTFCYATDQATTNLYEVLDCGIHQNGEIVRGTVVTYWTHRDEHGNPVCDYQNYIINLQN